MSMIGQSIGDEERNRHSSSTSTAGEFGRAHSTSEEEDTTRTAPTEDDDEQDEHDTSNDNIITKEETREPDNSSPPYEKLAQKTPKPMDYPAITFGPPMIILFDIVVPCIIYYVWYNIHQSQWKDQCQVYTNHQEICLIPKPQFNEHILGYAVISFGFGELYILFARIQRLVFHQEDCAPLLSRSKWELDATSWVYGVSMICALIPFIIGSSKQIPELYLYSPGFLMAFLGILMVLTLIPMRMPIGINSQPRGGRLRPFIYYAAEDFIAVDGLQDREFRVRFNARYDSSKAFRRMFVYLTLWWILGVCVYLGCLSAIIWTLDFHYAFGASLGVLFAYIIVWALVSHFWVQIDMERQKKVAQQRGSSKS